MDVEWEAISKAIIEKDITPLLEARINRQFFLDDEHLQKWLWIERYFEKYGEAPGLDALRMEFPRYELAEPTESWAYYIDELREGRTWAMHHDMLAEALDAHEEKDNDLVFKVINEHSQNLYEEVLSATDEDVTKTGAERLAYYDELGARGGALVGITTGLETLDLATGGLLPEQLITVAGPPKAGKSTLMLFMAKAAHARGHRVGFVSYEMSTREQTSRLDSMLAKVDYNHILQGKLSNKERRQIERAHRELDAMQPFVFIHDLSRMNLGALTTKINQHKFDIIFVDGAYLMEVDVPGVEPESPQALTWLTRNMKRMAQRIKVPVVISTQVLQWKMSKRKGVTLDSIGYSSSFAQDSDLILGVEGLVDEGRSMKVTITGARNSGWREVTVTRDWTHGKFEEAPTSAGINYDEDYDAAED